MSLGRHHGDRAQHPSGEGGEQGRRADAVDLLPRGRAGERLLAYFDDVYVVARPDRVAAVYSMFQEELWRHARIRIHGGKTEVGKLGWSQTRVLRCPGTRGVRE